MMNLLRKILFPFVPFYFLVTWFRNKCYDLGLFHASNFDIPIVKVGNLSTGGTGKTPMIEHLIKLLKDEYKIATLSRGYKRESKGFVIANANTKLSEIGDEPFQIAQKFNEIIVAVDANRTRAINELIALESAPDIILMDDAFQHRKVASGLNILLTDYNNLYVGDIVLPTGNLREPRSGAQRASIIVVSKCPVRITDEEKNEILKRLSPRANQDVFFSSIKYSDVLVSKESTLTVAHLKNETFTLVTGIANSSALVNYLKNIGLNFEHFDFADHHNFSDSEITQLNTKQIIITTEKDYWRLYNKVTTQLYYLPIEIEISEGRAFNGLITKYVSNLRLG